MLEILIFIGKILGTKNKHFIKIFKEEKAYLMGKIITIDNVIK